MKTRKDCLRFAPWAGGFVAILLLSFASALCAGCLTQRTGEPFIVTRFCADLAENGMSLGWSDSGQVPTFGHSCGGIGTLTIGPALDLVGLPVDLAIQAFYPARICVVDESGAPIEGAESIVTVRCCALDDTVLHRRTGRDGTFRIRRRVCNKAYGRVVSARIVKEGFRPLFVGNYDSYDDTGFFDELFKTNVVTLSMSVLEPHPGHVVERARDDPEGRFPPWPNPNDKGEGCEIVSIDCSQGKAYPWHFGDTSGGRSDLLLRVVSRKDTAGRISRSLELLPSDWSDCAFAVAAIGPEGPDYVPEHVDLRSNGTYFGGGKKGDGRGIAIFFRKNGDSKTGHYGRLDFYWEDGVPVGIRRVLYSDTPGERYLRFSAQ